jgi:hypothetical protein
MNSTDPCRSELGQRDGADRAYRIQFRPLLATSALHFPSTASLVRHLLISRSGKDECVGEQASKSRPDS